MDKKHTKPRRRGKAPGAIRCALCLLEEMRGVPQPQGGAVQAVRLQPGDIKLNFCPPHLDILRYVEMMLVFIECEALVTGQEGALPQLTVEVLP